MYCVRMCIYWPVYHNFFKWLQSRHFIAIYRLCANDWRRCTDRRFVRISACFAEINFVSLLDLSNSENSSFSGKKGMFLKEYRHKYQHIACTKGRRGPYCQVSALLFLHRPNDKKHKLDFQFHKQYQLLIFDVWSSI